MNTTLSSVTIAQFCKYLQDKDYLVDHRYQRSSKVWPAAARSALIETILLDYPIPKLALHQVTNLQERKTIHYIVDGQQRSQAIFDYYEDRYPLSRNVEVPEAQGRRFSQLSEDLQKQFVNYSLDFDVFSGVEDDQVREVFRRINSFTVPLNDEEQRHAKYQGSFKWFINSEARNYDEAFIRFGTFNERAVVRMGDNKWFTELCHAWENGITTTNKVSLDAIYRKNDPEFPNGDKCASRIELFVSWFVDLPELWKTSVCKPFSMYSLALAHSYVAEGGIRELRQDYDGRSVLPLASDFVCTERLSDLADVMDQDSEPRNDRKLAEFWRACDSQTNTQKNRRIRFSRFCRAIQK
jgi:hypothetical protein